MSRAYRSKTHNCVLARDEVGKARQTCYDLPPAGHAYGRTLEKDIEGAREVIGKWAAHTPRQRPEDKMQDFKVINKTAARKGIANAKQLADFRKGVDIKLTPRGLDGQSPRATHPIPSDLDKSWTYGRKMGASTPIGDVVGGAYALESEELKEAQYRMYAEQTDMPNGKHRIKFTKAASARIADARNRRHMAEMSSHSLVNHGNRKVSPRLHLEPLFKGKDGPHSARS
eukprot:TRINITY_DN100424_c0_g1_i1.p1 TRINITY_DN100424_c0_g1~~TRINITY_DN100424_c0_g1_i1.p1  ORF type:complete len:252 (-),score=28.50 TRINITY_DN100424_c0_g1_i1:81-764(-)